MEIKSIGVLRCGLFCAVLYGIFGLIEALFMMPFLTVMAMIAPHAGTQPGFGIGMAIVLPIFGLAGGFIGGVILAFIYNLVASWVGGLQVTLVAIQRSAESLA